MSDLQEASPEQRAHQLREDMERTARMPVRSPERGANVYREWQQAREVLAELLPYLSGYASEHEALTTKVGALLATFTDASDGCATWRTELPRGKAPAFRRALNALVRHIKGRLHDR